MVWKVEFRPNCKVFTKKWEHLFDREDALAVLGIALMFKTEFAKSTIICIFLVYKLFQES